MKFLLTLPFIFGLTAACTKEAASPGPASVNKAVLLRLVNDARKKGCNCGDVYYGPAAAVTWNDKLEKASEAHSVDMNSAHYFSHIAPDGSNAAVRLERVGYNWKTYGENIASGYRTEQEAVEGWLQSPGHCKNIMNKGYREMAVARVGNYWTQTFGAK